MSENTRSYTPSPSIVPFFTADKFANFIVGPVGSTKTTAGLVKILYEAKRVTPCRDGIRRSRCAVVRNTNQMLNDTTIPDFLKWFPEGTFGTYLRTEKKFILRVADVECEVLFRGLDGPDDVRRLLSLQLSFGVLDEFREIHRDVYDALTGRLGRYPDKSMNGVGCCDETGKQIHKVWGMSNPPDFDSAWETFLSDPPANAHVTIQPSGLSPEADWVEFLPDGYYENLCEGKDQDWIDVYVHGRFGASLSGRAVYDKSFAADHHVATSPLLPFASASNPIIVGLDFGRTPAAVIGQRNAMGQALIYDEITSENMGLELFIHTLLKPKLANRFPGMPYLVAGDPAGWAKSQINEQSCRDVLVKSGFKVAKPASNAIDTRLRAVEGLLLRSPAGKPSLLIDPRCEMLVKGFRGGYRYKVKKDGENEETPEKNKYSHCFLGGTPVSTPDGPRPIELVRVGDLVNTPIGPRLVTGTMSRRAWELLHVEFEDGSHLLVTKDHPIYGENGVVFSDALQYDTVLLCEGENKWDAQRNTPRSSTMGSSSIASPLGITKPTTSDTAARTCTGMCGKKNAGRSLMDTWYTIATTTARTIASRIWSFFSRATTARITQENGSPTVIPQLAGASRPPERQQSDGIDLTRDGRGTGSTGSGLGLESSPSSRSAHGAEEHFLAILPTVRRAIAECRAKGQRGLPAASMTRHDSARYADAISGLIATGRLARAPRIVRISSVVYPNEPAVYDLTIDEAHCFFANGILVSNCHDALQYFCMIVEGAYTGAMLGNQNYEPERVACGGWT